MSQIVDNLIAYRVLTMLVKPFSETDAYRLGIIDNKGKNLIKPSSLRTTEEKSAYTFLHRLVFNMKKIINKLPGGESKLKSVISAYFLIREYYEKNDRSTSMMEQKFHKLLATDAILAEESILIEKFIKMIEEGERIARKAGQPANSEKHSDLYTDENPKDTITGLKFATVGDAKASVSRIRRSGRKHAHKVQAAVAMEQRARAAGKSSAAAVYRAYINSVKKTEEVELKEDEGGGAPANVTGAGVSTDIPLPKKKDLDKYKQTNQSGVVSIARRNKAM